MKIISWNVNGIRAVYKKDFVKQFKKINADFFCLQEVKCQDGQVPEELLNLKGYYSYFSFAEKKGYSGTAIFTKKKPEKVEIKLGFKNFDDEGRIIKLEFRDFILINLYFPHGGRKKEKLVYKLEVYKKFLKYLERIKDKKVIIIGDFNIAHKEIDLERPKSNKDNIMFTPVERKQLDKIIELGFIDTFRKFNKKSGNYTWWPYMANARQRNLGWRIDYAFVSKDLSSKLKKAYILKNFFGSDHCPIGIEV